MLRLKSGIGYCQSVHLPRPVKGLLVGAKMAAGLEGAVTLLAGVRTLASVDSEMNLK
jgi:hypothetical protein